MNESPEDTVWGVLYEIGSLDLPKLDRVEGGYERGEVVVLDDAGKAITAQTYVSENQIDDPIPYGWYLATIVDGGHEHGLSVDYVESLESQPTKLDDRKKP